MENKAWKPTTAGILSIIAGVPAVGSGIIIALLGSTMAWIDIVPLVPNILGIIAILLIVLGVIAIVGGIFALHRRTWGLALTGAICALAPPLSILGVLAIIFVVIGKDDFN
jgi:hypothetical protein